MMSDPHVKQRAKRYAKALSNMTDKTYTQTEVDALIAAEREAVLRKAADIALTKHEAAVKWGSHYIKDFDGKTDSGLIAEEILAFIDQPSVLDDALAAAKAEGVREAIEATRSLDAWDRYTPEMVVDVIQALLPTDEQKDNE